MASQDALEYLFDRRKKLERRRREKRAAAARERERRLAAIAEHARKGRGGLQNGSRVRRLRAEQASARLEQSPPNTLLSGRLHVLDKLHVTAFWSGI